MKIMLINDSVGTGGTESYYADLSNALRKEGHLVLNVFFGENKKINNFYVIKDPKTKFFRYFSAVFFNIRVYNDLNEKIKTFNPDVIHLLNINKYPLTVLFACRGRNVVQTVNDYGLICPTAWCVYKRSYKICSGGFGIKCLNCLNIARFFGFGIVFAARFLLRKVVKKYIAPSKMLKSYLEKHNFRNVFYLPYFINTQNWKFQKNKKGDKILYVGQLTEQKGVKFLLEAFHLVIKKRPNAVLNIVGDGQEMGYLKLRAEQLGIKKRVNFIGSLPRKKIAGWYRNSKVVVVPSIWMEQFGIVGLEALASGTPCIGSRIGGIPEWLKDGKNGFLVKRMDYGEIAEKVIKLLENSELVKKFGIYGRKFVETNFNQKKHMYALSEIYKK